MCYNPQNSHKEEDVSGQKYTRPKIERVNVVNSERRPGYRTEAEEEIKRAGKERTRQIRNPFTLAHYAVGHIYVGVQKQAG